MPDRDDPYGMLSGTFDDSFADPPNPYSQGMTDELIAHKQFDPQVERELLDFADSGEATIIRTWENDHPGETYTAYHNGFEDRIVAIPMPQTSGLVLGGEVKLVGISYYTGGTGLFQLRDGLDGNGMLMVTLPVGAPTTTMVGMPGLHFKYGLYIDFTATSNQQYTSGAVFVNQRFSK